MIIPVGFSSLSVEFVGPGVPTGAAITFGVNQDVLLTTVAQIGQAFAVAWDNANVKSLYDQSATVNNVHVKMGPNDVGPSGDRACDFQGTAVGEVGYPGVSALITKATALGGRKNRGRFFLPGITEADVAIGGALESSFLSACDIVMTNFFTELGDGGIPMVILHNDATAPTDVTALLVNSQSATQRRRNRR